MFDPDLDFLGLVKLVNYVREQVKKGNQEPKIQDKAVFDDDLFLMPVMEDDAVLYTLEEVLQESAGDDSPSAASDEVQELRDQLASLRSQFAAYREDVKKYIKLDATEDNDEDAAESSRAAAAATAAIHKMTLDRKRVDDNYFTGYSYNAIHESMLKDRVRTDGYRDFIYENKDIFQDKVVLDVGCGTGILSMFCARAGARLVVAVDNSEIIEKAEQIVRANGLQDKVKCVRGKIEDVRLPVDKVDIIVSEWMGYCLLFESMLDSVVFARDKYLIPGGLMVPSHIDVLMAPLADSELKGSYIDFWKGVYGFDMTAMLERAHEEALVRLVDGKELCADTTTISRLDLHTVAVKDLDFQSKFQVSVADEFQDLEGFVLWFDTFFMRSPSTAPPIVTENSKSAVAEAKRRGQVAFSTGPAPDEPTHWQQTVCLIKKSESDSTAPLKSGTVLEGLVKLKKRKDAHRSLDIEIQWSVDGGKEGSQKWFLE